jgi:hypothetical protein
MWKNPEAPRRPTDAGGRLGELVIAASDMPKMLTGDEVTIHVVQQRPGREVFVVSAGRQSRAAPYNR